MKDSEDGSKKGDLIMLICVLTKYQKCHHWNYHDMWKPYLSVFVESKIGSESSE